MNLGRKINNRTTFKHYRYSRVRIGLIAVIVSTFVVWAANAKLEEVVRGDGKVVPKVKNQIIQNLEGGIVSQIFVAEGDVIAPGSLVAEMDKTRFRSAFQELRDQYLALALKLERLSAEFDINSNFRPSDKFQKHAAQYADSEVRLFIARQSERLEIRKNLLSAIDLKEKEVDILRSMVASLAVPEIELIRALQLLTEVQRKLISIEVEFETSRAQEYAETLIRKRQVEEQMRGSEDKLRRTDVRSPIRGIVNKVLSTTIGGVVQPGDPLLEILSLEDSLRVEGRIDPRDIGFVYVGMPATIKLTAFDFSIYGTLSGKVVHVGADTIVDEKRREARSYYEVFIELDANFLSGPSGPAEIRPGMQAQIELNSGQKTVLQYLLKPLFKTTEALSER